MKIAFSKNQIINSAISPFEQYCVGYPGKGNYLTSLVMGIGNFPQTFSHPGSKLLDSIVAYDRAEISDTYIGQVNMSIVSSFCGPQGLIWGYDIAQEEGYPLPSFLFPDKIKEFEGIKIRNGKNLRKASKALFGGNGQFHFPLLPGTHVPCAGRFYYKTGPTYLYAANAIGIPKNRNKSACLLMEDVGEIINKNESIESVKEKIIINIIRSVLEIGKNQKINYEEIFFDLISKDIKSNTIGCALVSMPYFLLAKKALTKNLTTQTLTDWTKEAQNNFLINHSS